MVGTYNRTWTATEKMAFGNARDVFRFAMATILICGMASTASAVSLVKKHSAWSVYSHEASAQKICFAASKPKVTRPKGANRSAVFFYVSAWPNDGVKSEVSIRLGYPIKPGSTVQVKIGGKNFNLFAKDFNAFVADATEELKLIDAMRAGSTMTISGVSKRGTNTSDSYSLSGVTAALGTLAVACP